MDTSAFEPMDHESMERLLNRTKQRSAQLRRRRILLFFGSLAHHQDGLSRPKAQWTRNQPRRFSPTTMILGSVGAAVIVGVVIAVVGVTATPVGPHVNVPSGSATSSQAPVVIPAPAAVVNAVTGVSAQEANEVGLPLTSSVVPPTVKSGQPPLEIGGKPAAVFIGGEFCPYCAAERWAIVMAFGRFGTFSHLSETESSPWDADPSTSTFSFYGSSYTSPVLVLDAIEHESNDTNGLGTRTTLQPLTEMASHVWAKYDNPEGFPFLDIGNSVFILSPSFDPAVLSGLDQADIASRLTDPNDPVTSAIVGAANYITAAICSVIRSNGLSWCSQPATIQAAEAMGLP